MYKYFWNFDLEYDRCRNFYGFDGSRFLVNTPAQKLLQTCAGLKPCFDELKIKLEVTPKLQTCSQEAFVEVLDT